MLKKKKLSFLKYFLVFFIAVFFSIFGEQKALKTEGLPILPKTEDINPRLVSAKIFASILFGGFRGIVVDLTWMYIDNLWHHSRFYQLPSLYEIVTLLQPDYIDGWIMGGWHMAYNMSLDVPNVKGLSPQIKKKIEMEWVLRGLNFLKTGATVNPNSYKLHFEIGWTYYHRLKDYESSIIWFEKAVSKDSSQDIAKRLIPYALEKNDKKEFALKKWIDLQNDSSYSNLTVKKIVDKNIQRLQSMVSNK